MNFTPATLPVQQQIALLLALHGHRLGGVLVLCREDPRAAGLWAAQVAEWRSRIDSTPAVVRAPVHCGIESMLGGVDVLQTVLSGRRMHAPGVLARTGDGLLLLPLTELQPTDSLRGVCNALDQAATHTDTKPPCVIAMSSADTVAEIHSGDRAIDPALQDRLAFCLPITAPSDVDVAAPFELSDANITADITAALQQAAVRWRDVVLSDESARRLCVFADELGITSTRSMLFCALTARSLAAFAQRSVVDDDDLDHAMALCFGWRAQVLPAESTSEHAPTFDDNADASPEHHSAPPPDPPPELEPSDTGPAPSSDSAAMDSMEPIQSASLPPQLLASLQAVSKVVPALQGRTGRSGQLRHSSRRGRCIGTMRFQSGRGHKVHLLATLSAAAPWQPHRKRKHPGAGNRPIIEPQDMRAGRFKQAAQTVVIFAVDASGSAARERLAEARGAVELLLSECYVRRDEVALIVFQGATASLMLPPTRSLVAARRKLTQLPAGGGTPLASALELTATLAADVTRSGNTPLLCLLTDGRANVDRDGIGGRERAMAQAIESAGRLGHSGLRALVIDIARRAGAVTRQLAGAMHADYIALPRADAKSINRAVSDVLPSASRRDRTRAA